MDIKKSKEILVAFNLAGIVEIITQEEFEDVKQAIETVLSELEKKEAIINEMAEQLAGLAIFDIEKDEPLVLGDKEEVKEYFEKKVEGK